jgi:hypothetical protein
MMNDAGADAVMPLALALVMPRSLPGRQCKATVSLLAN